MSVHYTTTLRCDASEEFRPFVRCTSAFSLTDLEQVFGAFEAAKKEGWRLAKRDGRSWHLCPKHDRTAYRIWVIETEEAEA